jgi:hypothetical protein
VGACGRSFAPLTTITQFEAEAQPSTSERGQCAERSRGSLHAVQEEIDKRHAVAEQVPDVVLSEDRLQQVTQRRSLEGVPEDRSMVLYKSNAD